MHPSYIECRNVLRYINAPIDLFLDVGVGQMGSEAQAVFESNPGCTIIGFEPNLIRYERLNPSYPGTLRNELVTSKVGEVIGCECGEFTILYADDDMTHGGDDYELKSYKSVTLDSVAEHSDFNSLFIWADTEGSELEILKGATTLLSLDKPVYVNLEVRPREHITTSYNWPSYDEVEEFLRRYYILPVEQFTLKGNNHKDILFMRE